MCSDSTNQFVKNKSRPLLQGDGLNITKEEHNYSVVLIFCYKGKDGIGIIC